MAISLTSLIDASYKGDQGDQGSIGSQGLQGTSGVQGIQGVQGLPSPDAEVTIVSCLFT